MTENLLLSIVVPLYNREKLIIDCLRSCQQQTYKNIEIIVVDDASTDRSVEVVKELMKSDPRIRLYYNQSNRKLGYTRNVGIRHAKGELIAFLDSDDLFLPEKIENCVNAYLRTGADCINSPVISRFHNKPEEVTHIVPLGDAITDYLSRKIVWKVIGPVWTRSFLSRVGWFVEGEEIFGSEDFEFHIRALINQVNICYLEEPLSIQMNIDPAIDTVKIRHPSKFAVKARKKLFSRILVLKTLWRARLPLRKKVGYSLQIAYYLMALWKNTLVRLSLKNFFSINGYFVKVALSRMPGPVKA